jgi:hypothetical protein
VRQGFGSATLKAATSSNDQACNKDEEYKTQFHSQYESGTNLFDQAYSIISQCLNANTSGWLVDSKFDDENPNRFYIALSNWKDSGDVKEYNILRISDVLQLRERGLRNDAVLFYPLDATALPTQLQVIW